mmetsp:Transcript_2460/g.5725  ORF Transcript_2460/g.5725 Transcript_2460/m.5725 type:complete len:84 (-) Transcript_2460:1302-1553(-)
MHRQQAKQHGLQMQKYSNSILGNDFLDPTLKHAVVKCRRVCDSRDWFYTSVQCIAVRCDAMRCDAMDCIQLESNEAKHCNVMQ